MRRYIIALWMGVALFLSSCSDVIDLEPEQSTTYTNFFKTLKDAEGLLVTLESNMRKCIKLNNLESVGIILDTSRASVTIDLRDRKPFTCSWARYYNAIYSADMIIDNAHRFNVKEEKIRPYVLQAYFAKGVVYFMLAQNFGECVVKEGGSTDFSKYAKSPVSKVLETAANFAEKALELPVYEDLRDANGNARTTKQYAGKGAAAALLANIYAWWAGVENKPEYWAKAEEYCTMIIDGKAGVFSLESDPEALCTKGMSAAGRETIWEIFGDGTEFMSGVGMGGFAGFPLRAGNDYTPGGKQPAQKIWKKTIEQLYDPADRRLDAYLWGFRSDSLFVLKNGETNIQVYRVIDGSDTIYYKYNKVTKVNEKRKQLLESGDVIVQRYANNGEIFPFKHRNVVESYNVYLGWMLNGFDQCWVVWRLADVYLLRAECRARQNKATAAEDLNKVRERAYGNTEYNFPSEIDRQKGLANDIQLAIFRERDKELIFEDGHRYFDVIRNGLEYIHRELPPAFRFLTEEDVEKGALYLPISSDCFSNNDLMRQNRYWEPYLGN